MKPTPCYLVTSGAGRATCNGAFIQYLLSQESSRTASHTANMMSRAAFHLALHERVNDIQSALKKIVHRSCLGILAFESSDTLHA